VCMQRYDLKSKQPMVLDCGHSICKECLYIIIHRNPICPFDRQGIIRSFTFHKPNFSLISLLTDQDSSKNSYPTIAINTPFSSFYIQCPKSHQLIFSPFISHHYKSLTTSNAELHCDFCNKIWEGGSFHCKYCMYDVCEECYEEEEEARSSSRLDVRCGKMHRMYIYKDNHKFYARGGVRCKSICKECRYKWRGYAWSCRECKEDLCEICVRKEISREDMRLLR
jgi:hypothetical protein